MKTTKQFFLEAFRIIEALTIGTFLDKFEDWKDKSTDQLANWFVANKASLDKFKKEMPKKFQPPIGKKAYRGASLPPDIVIAILKKKAGKSPTIVTIAGDGTEGAEKFIVIPNVPYTPHRKAQSWTLNKKIAADFSSPSSGPASDLGVSEDNVGVMYEATIDNTFYLNPKAFADSDSYSNEQEVLRLGGKGNYTMYIRLKDLPQSVAVQYGGKGIINKILDSYRVTIFKFLNQWQREDIDDYEAIRDVTIEKVLIDKKSGKIQIQNRDGNVLSIDDFFNRCEKKKILQKKSWRDKKTPYNRAYINKKISAFEKKFANLLGLV